jgi:hypothetical protein
MSRRVLRHALNVAALLAPLSGCSFYLNRPVTFQVRDAETKRPIEGAEIKVTYLRYIEVAIPVTGAGPEQGVTDRDGKLTLVVDPCKDQFTLSATARGYLPEQHQGRDWVAKRITPRKRFEWKNDFILEMYTAPEAEVDLIFPDGYRGIVLVRCAPTDRPPEVPGRRRFRYDVPASGIVEIREAGLMDRPSLPDRIHVQFRDGTTVPTAFGHNDPEVDAAGGRRAANDVALRFIDMDWEHRTWVCVLGTKDDADSAMRTPSELGEADRRDLDRPKEARGD